MSQTPHILLVNSTIPNCAHGGGAMTAYAMGRALLNNGYRVTVIALGPERTGGGPDEDRHHIDHWRKMGAECDILSDGITRLSRFDPRRLLSRDRIFPSRALRPSLEACLVRLRPDAMLLYHWEALAAAWGIRTVPKVAGVGDPVHLPGLFRREFQRTNNAAGGRRTLWYQAANGWVSRFQQIEGMVSMLNECAVAGAFAAHHASMLREMGASRCRYFRTPVADPGFKGVSSRPGTWRILHIGHLNGTATLAGIQLLVEGVLPQLLKKVAPDALEIHLVGGKLDSVPSELRRKFDHPSIRLRGQITPPDEEFHKASILIVPTPIELGIRVRIITGFSFGVPIVAHVANKAGIPELIDGENCLLASDSAGLAAACLRLRADADLQARLRSGARATFEKYFSLTTAGKVIVESLDGAIQRVS